MNYLFIVTMVCLAFLAGIIFAVRFGVTGNISRLKKENLEKIMALFEKYPQLDNATIRQNLGFKDRTIVNYMDALEKMNKVKQIGKVGKYAHYVKI